MPLTPNSLSAPDRTQTSRQAAGGSQMRCVPYAALFQHPLLEEPVPANAPVEVRRRSAALVRRAQDVCEACPLVAPCLYRAVVEHDVSGYVGGTTPRQRAEIRQRLAVTVEPEDLDTLAGVTGRHRQIDHDEVVRLRHTNPQESLESLAHRLGCSLSTVKRHLRRERGHPSAGSVATPAPTLGQVLAVAADVVGGSVLRQAAA